MDCFLVFQQENNLSKIAFVCIRLPLEDRFSIISLQIYRWNVNTISSFRDAVAKGALFLKID